MRHHPDRSRLPRRGERGFSLVELVVVMIILAVVVPLAIRFTSDALGFADDQSARARAAQTVTDVIVTLERDLGAARSCRDSLLDPPVIAIDGAADTLEFISDVDGDGDGDYVRYQVGEVGGGPKGVYRTTATEPDGTATQDERCSFTDPANQSTEMLAALPGGSTGGFTARHPIDGAVQTRTCRGITETSEFDRCDFSSIIVEITIETLVPDTADHTITREIAIDRRWGRT